jgi:pyridoxine 5-phosphate synthase
MAPTKALLDFALKLSPEMVMFVPEGRDEITTEGGLNVKDNEKRLSEMIKNLKENGIIASVFVDADLEQINAAVDVGAEVCEIHTGPYANTFYSHGRDKYSLNVQDEIKKIKIAGEFIKKNGLQFNAGHALNYFNVQPIAAISGIRELHIGHAIVSRSVFVGIREAVREMKRLMREVRS